MSKVDLFGIHIAPSRTSKALCVITAGVAFVLGTVLGVLIPLYVLPPLYNTSVAVPEISKADTVVQTYPDSRINLLDTLTKKPDTTEQSNDLPIVEKSIFINEQIVPEPFPEMEDTAEIKVENKTKNIENKNLAKDLHSNRKLIDSIYWSDEVERVLPRGFDDVEVRQWREFCQHSAVVKMEQGCGRMQNRKLTFENGTRSCGRYRQNYDQIQGEIFSFYLSRELGIKNLPPTAMGLVKPRNWQWTAIRSQLNLAQWAEDRPVVLTKFLGEMASAYIPEDLRTTKRRMHPVDIELKRLSLKTDRQTIIELAQWSDLIIFDYLTANLDRIVNNLYNMQWNPAMMEYPAHNLAKDDKTGLLIFLDNESGLLHGYRLIAKYEVYHRTMLDALCVFRKSTVDKIKHYKNSGDIGDVLRRTFRQTHPELLDYLPTLPEKSIKILNNRINNVYEVITECERIYSS